MSFTDTAKQSLCGCAAWTAASRSVVNVAMPHLRGKWSPMNAILRTLEVCCIRYSFARQFSPSLTPRSLFGHADGNIHAQEGRGLSDKSAPQRQNMRVIPRNCDADQIAISDNAIGWIEVDPTGAGKIDLHPGVGGAASRARLIIFSRDKD